MEYKNVDEVINKLMLSYSSLVGLISRAMENDKGENSKNTGLTKSQFALLQLISSLEKATVSTLVAVTGTSKSSTSLTLTKMENDGYIKRDLAEVEKQKKLEDKALPTNIDYKSIKGLRLESSEKLSLIRPVNIGQASRISGVNPADINVLLIYLTSYGK